MSWYALRKEIGGSATEAAKAAEENAASHLTYDGALNGTGAFAKANEEETETWGQYAKGKGKQLKKKKLSKQL